MRSKVINQKRLAVLAMGGLGLIASTVSAAVVGNLNFTNSAGGGVTISSSAIDFLLPAAGGNGAVVTGINTNVSYTGGGPLVSNVAGLAVDITGPGSILDFITFTGNANLHFDLSALGPGVTNTTAVNTFDPNSVPSSPSVGSPYILQATATGTTLTFTANGIARDTSSPNSLWSGLFTTQLAGVTPFAVQQTLLASGSISSTFSASIVATGVAPEPASATLLLTCLISATGIRRRRATN